MRILVIAADPKNAQARNNYGTYLYQVERYRMMRIAA